MNSEFKNAAKACDDDRGEDPVSRAGLEAKWSPDGKGNDAFGKCV